MKQYIKALEHILEKGKQRDDRTGVGTRGVFGYQMRFDLRNSFPAVTTKKLAWKSVCLLYTSPSPRDVEESRMPSSA